MNGARPVPVPNRYRFLPRFQIVQHQGAGGFAADHQLIAHFQVLQARGQRAVLYLDAEEFHEFFVVGTGNTVGTHQRPAVHLQTDHHELAVFKTQAGIAGGAETEQCVVPVMYAGNGFEQELAGWAGHGYTCLQRNTKRRSAL
jgi:hypothetical protein